jgi:hypothetical protein
MHLVVYTKDNSAVLWGRFPLYANGRKFIEAISKEYHNSTFVLFDTEKWQVVHEYLGGEKI